MNGSAATAGASSVPVAPRSAAASKRGRMVLRALARVVATTLWLLSWWWMGCVLLSTRPTLSVRASMIASAALGGLLSVAALGPRRLVRDPTRALTALSWMVPAGTTLLAVAWTLAMPTVVATGVREEGARWIAAARGRDHDWTHATSAVAQVAAQWVAGPPSTPRVAGDATPSRAPATQSSRTQVSAALEIPLPDDASAVVVEVVLSGPGGSVRRPYLLDTGASFTTMSATTAAAIGVRIPPDAPRLTFHTASGERESALVALPALQIGDARVEGLTVSVCEDCVNARTDGLIGLNALADFTVEMDYLGRRVRLVPRPLPPDARRDRTYDIHPMVAVTLASQPQVWLSRIDWEVALENRSQRPVFDAAVEVRFDGGARLRSAPVARLDPGVVATARVQGEVGVTADPATPLNFSLELVEAYW